MFGHAEGEKLATAIMNKLDEDKVNVNSILILSSYGPNVNKTIFRKINQTKGIRKPRNYQCRNL